jgi:uncharacterized protein (TIGR02271 family)
MTTTGRTIIGVFDESALANNAIAALRQAGFRDDQIQTPGHHAAGGFLAGLKSMFTGEDASTESVAGDLTRMGISNDEARYYENEYQVGHALVAVRAGGREQEAMDILRANGASMYRAGQGNVGTSRSARATSSHADQHTHGSEVDASQHMELREEQLNVNKQRVQSGEVDLRKDVVTEQQTINVPVTHEEVYVERHPVTDATVDTTPIGEGETILVPLTEERVNVRKETLVTGEVSIGKRAVEGTQRVADTVRREELSIEQEGNAPIHGTPSDPFHPDQVNPELTREVKKSSKSRSKKKKR